MNRTIVYTSDVPQRQNGAQVPTGLSNILNVARERNKEHGISGALYFRNGRYIQFLEGPTESLTQLYKNIIQDERHKNVRIIYERALISEKAFDEWSMKLVIDTSKDADLIQFLRLNKQYLNEISSAHKLEFQHFFDFDKLMFMLDKKALTDEDSLQQLEQNNAQMHLKRWPDFSQLTPTPNHLNACALLTSRSVTLTSLANQTEFGSREALNAFLTQLREQQILLIEKCTDHLQDKTIHSNHTHSESSFYSKMLRFLTGTGDQ